MSSCRVRLRTPWTCGSVSSSEDELDYILQVDTTFNSDELLSFMTARPLQKNAPGTKTLHLAMEGECPQVFQVQRQALGSMSPWKCLTHPWRYSVVFSPTISLITSSRSAINFAIIVVPVVARKQGISMVSRCTLDRTVVIFPDRREWCFTWRRLVASLGWVDGRRFRCFCPDCNKCLCTYKCFEA